MPNDVLAPGSARSSVGKILQFCLFQIGGIQTSLKFNPFGAQARILQDNWANTMAADALAPCVARPSAAMVLTVILHGRISTCYPIVNK